MENKPFVFGVATSGDNFTDRKKETARLLSNFRHGVNTVLISPRRWGKTSLVRKVCRLAQSDTLKVVYLDIFSCRSEREFYDAFASAVLKQTSSKLEEWMENARLFLSRISPKISLGTEPMTDFFHLVGTQSQGSRCGRYPATSGKDCAKKRYRYSRVHRRVSTDSRV